jgi:hypothetical protein
VANTYPTSWWRRVGAALVGSHILLIAPAHAAEPATRPAHSRLVCPGPDGRLVYVADDRGNVIPDFSHCGYAGGGVAIPSVPVRVTVKPGDGKADDLPRLQAAIDEAAQLTPDADGFRGAVELARGTYRVNGSLRLNASGVVLRGAGQDERDGTILRATLPKQHAVVIVSGEGAAKEIAGTRQEIADEYVPTGSRSFRLANVSALAVGDDVVVHRPSTAEWIATLKMDRLNETYKTTRLTEWKPGDFDLNHRRRITGIDGDRVTTDVPIVHALDRRYGGGFVYKFQNPGQISRAGVENLRIVSAFDKSKVSSDDAPRGNETAIRRFTDEEHAWVGVALNNVRDAWVRDVTVQHVGYAAVQTNKESTFVTVADCFFLDPVSQTAGGRKYSFNCNGQMGLFLRCYARNARHDFVLGARVVGPNAFVDCRTDLSISTSEPHHRYSAGCLWDNVKLTGAGEFLAVNRGDSGSGHGWAGANMVFWNCAGRSLVVMDPPTDGAQNYAIGWLGPADPKSAGNEEAIKKMLGWVKTRSTAEFPYRGLSVHGDGYIESPTGPVEPRSLYFKQLEDRLGKQAVANVK